MASRIDELVNKYELSPLAREGGAYRFISRFGDGAGSIFYLITKDTFSSLHTLDSDELWFFLEGDEAEQYLIKDERIEVRILSKDERCSLVKAGYAQATRVKEGGEYAFFSTVMSPAYSEDNFTSPSKEFIKAHSELSFLFLKDMK